jgi:hypothetical protein
MNKLAPSFIATVFAGLALFFTFVAIGDVPKNNLITAPAGFMIILAIGSGTVLLSVAWVWMKNTRKAFYSTLAACLLLLLFSLFCLYI